MNIRPDPQSGTVLIRLTAREATRMASELVRAALASGAKIEQEDRQEPTEEKVERES